MKDYTALLAKQREFFLSGKTLAYKTRKTNLEKLYRMLKDNEDRIIDALHEDLGKSSFESYATEIGIAYSEIRYLMKNLKKLMKRKHVSSPITIFKASSYTLSEPMGNTLIFSPWNYPLQLTIVPLAGAIAGGNTAIVKPSRYSANTSSLLSELISRRFDEEYIALVQGGHEENSALLELRYDMIFFTGSPAVGKIVAAKAAETLTPCTLELGGKSPVIIDGTLDMDLTARRLMWGKLLNSGQTCVGPDYVLVKKGYEEALIAAIRRQASKMFPDPFASDEYPKIINEKHFSRICSLIKGSPVAFGGASDKAQFKIEPTVLYPVKETDPVMQEEIFGPVLPILSYSSIDEAIDFIRKREKPLALYIFSKDKKTIEKVHSSVSFGGGCVNDTVIHLSNPKLPFGGVGASGMGAYHGKKSFETFTRRKSIVSEATWIDMPIRFAPFGNKIKLLRKLM